MANQDNSQNTQTTAPSGVTGAPPVTPATPTVAGATGNAESAANKALFHLAFKRVEAEIYAVPHERLTAMNFDARGVVTTIVGVYPAIFSLRAEIVAQLNGFDIGVLDKLKDFALAFAHAHARFSMGTEASNELVKLAERGVVIRDQLQSDAIALSKRGLIKAELEAKFHNGNGYKNIAFDTVGLVEVFMDAWPNLQGKVPFTLEDLEEARVVANGIIELLGQREQGPVERSKAGIVRQQAYVLLADAYEEVRHAVAFVRRHEGDAALIAPPLFAGRTRRGNGPKEDEDTPPLSPIATATETNAPNVTALNAQATNVPVGHPGSPAFTR